jgi:hypothetical protein
VVDFNSVVPVATIPNGVLGVFHPGQVVELLVEASWLGVVDFGAAGHVDTILRGGVATSTGDLKAGTFTGVLVEASQPSTQNLCAVGRVDTIGVFRAAPFRRCARSPLRIRSTIPRSGTSL